MDDAVPETSSLIIHLDTPVDDGNQSVPLAALGERTARLEITADRVSRMNTMPCRLPRHYDRDRSAYLGRLDGASRLSVASKSNTILQCHPSTSLRVMCEKMGICTCMSITPRWGTYLECPSVTTSTMRMNLFADSGCVRHIGCATSVVSTRTPSTRCKMASQPPMASSSYIYLYSKRSHRKTCDSLRSNMPRMRPTASGSDRCHCPTRSRVLRRDGRLVGIVRKPGTPDVWRHQCFTMPKPVAACIP